MRRCPSRGWCSLSSFVPTDGAGIQEASHFDNLTEDVGGGEGGRRWAVALMFACGVVERRWGLYEGNVAISATRRTNTK